MDSNKQLELANQERLLALDKWNQCKIVVEKLEEEIANMRKTCFDKKDVDEIKQEYSNVIRMLELKINNLQHRLKGEVEKNEEIAKLTKENEELTKKNEELDKTSAKHYSMYLQTRDEYLILESKILNTGNILRYNEEKYNCLSSVEDSQMKLLQTIQKLSTDCNDLEIALEVCHKRIQLYELEKNRLNQIVKKLRKEKENLLVDQEKLLNNAKLFEEKFLKSKSEFNEKLETETLLTKETADKIISILFVKLDKFLCSSEQSALINTNSNDFFSVNTRAHIESFKQKLELICNKNDTMKMEVFNLNEKIRKYKKHIMDTNLSMEKLKKEMLICQNELKYRKEIVFQIKKENQTNTDIEHQIKSHQVLYNKWKKEIIDLIERFRRRMLYLKKNYKKAEKENVKLKDLIRNHICTINKFQLK